MLEGTTSSLLRCALSKYSHFPYLHKKQMGYLGNIKNKSNEFLKKSNPLILGKTMNIVCIRFSTLCNVSFVRVGKVHNLYDKKFS